MHIAEEEAVTSRFPTQLLTKGARGSAIITIPAHPCLDRVLHPGALYPGGCETRSVLSTLSHMRDPWQTESGTDSAGLGLLPAPRTSMPSLRAPATTPHR